MPDSLVSKNIQRFNTGIIGGVAAINLLLAVLSFFKDILLAAYMGTSEHSDAILTAFFVPDTIGNNLIASAAGVAAVPLFSILVGKNETQKLQECFQKLIGIFLVVMLLLTVVIYLFAEQAVSYLGRGFSADTAAVAHRLMYMFLPAIVLFPATAISASLLQAFEKFKRAAFIPVLYNVIFLAGVVLVWLMGVSPDKGVYPVAVSIVLGVAAMLVYAMFHVKRSGIELLPHNRSAIRKKSIDIGSFNNIFTPYILILFSSQAVLMFERFLASNMETGSISGLNYAFRLAQFPIWVFIAAVSAVILPSMSKNTEIKNMSGMRQTFSESIKLALLWALPLTLIMNILATPIITVLLKHGEFDGNSVRITSGILWGYSLTIIWQGITLICTRAFLAAGKMKKPMIALAFSAVVNIIADVVFTHFYSSQGLGYGAALGAFTGACLMIYLSIKEFEMNLSDFLDGAGGIIFSNALLSLVLLFSRYFWYILNVSSSSIYMGIYSISAFLACILIYLGGLSVCKVFRCNI